ncbi:unnamed protein product [Peronospora destructor]|uniref:Small EDRK-rich factor-like N-terminal domain-containing protein n=1 Tax=Peronospora destructor TaxID=86335 RepID=A0AAV0U175_9STRA|nr:unnamed protein product [Peronospora destructor]
MREQRKAEETTGKKRPSRAEAVAEQRALKKRKMTANKSKVKAEKRKQEAAAKAEGEALVKKTAEMMVDTASIHTNLLKKAERNAQRLEELKKTEGGAEKAKIKG